MDIPNNTRVKVNPESPSGKPWPPYTGLVKDIRKNVKGLGSVEYLIEDTETKRQKWVYDTLIKII